MNIYRKPSIRLKLVFANAIVLLFGVLVGWGLCRALNTPISIELDTTVVNVERHGPAGVSIKRGDEILAVAFVLSDRYKIDAYAAGLPSLSAKFAKNSQGPSYVGLWVNLDKKYLVIFNSEGEEVRRVPADSSALED